ncbi:hypothetical protein GCM10009551_077420 [Nocardiopsis tropica]|uniref:hypothetical protein n=1 Tax=Tsukamurella strandjordii TaxID=147577 RepID=UPI0031DF25D4
MTSEAVTPDAVTSDAAPQGEAADGADRACRGRTVIDDRVRQRLIEHAVLSVPGTVRHRGLPLRQLPSIRFADSERKDVQVQVAAEWPLDASRLVDSVRWAVDDELARSLGESPSSVHVHVARVSGESSAPRRALALHTATETEPEPHATLDARRNAPRRAAGSSIVAVPVLFAFLVLGVLALRDSLVSLGWVGGGRWIDAVPRIADDLRWAWWTWPAAIAAIVVGLVLVIAAVKPRKRSHTPISDELWLGRRAARARRKGARS